MKYISIFLLLISMSISLYAQDLDIRQYLKTHVETLSSESLKGRATGSQGEKAAAEYLYDRLEELGIIMLTPKTGQDFMIVGEEDTLSSLNILGIVEGYDKELKNEYIVIGAGIDNIGISILDINGKKEEQIYPGAYNNASGVAAMIEVARKIASTPFLFKRSIIFAGFGAEKMGSAGSWYFVNQAFSEVSEISLMIDLNMIGKSSESNRFVYYTGVQNPEISLAIDNVIKNTAFTPPVMGYGSMNSSSYLAFYEKKIPITLFTTGRHRDVNTIRDIPSTLDYSQIERICDFVYLFTMEIANSEERIRRGIETVVNANPEENIYSVFDVDKRPEFFHGDESTFLNRWVYSYLKYPDIPLAQGIQGKVIVEFIVEANGEVTNVKVVKSVDEYLDAEAVKVVSASPKWTPGVLGGKKVRVKYSIPVEFRLESTSK